MVDTSQKTKWLLGWFHVRLGNPVTKHHICQLSEFVATFNNISDRSSGFQRHKSTIFWCNIRDSDAGTLGFVLLKVKRGQSIAVRSSSPSPEWKWIFKLLPSPSPLTGRWRLVGIWLTFCLLWVYSFPSHMIYNTCESQSCKLIH